MNSYPPKRPFSDPDDAVNTYTTQLFKKRAKIDQQNIVLTKGSQSVPLDATVRALAFTAEGSAQDAAGDLENDLMALRLQRLQEYHQPVYIPPMAKANLQSRDDELFSLMDKVQEFLDSQRQVMLILGDSGAGKSTFNRHVENLLWNNYNKGDPIPLHISLPTIREPEENVIDKQLRIHDFNDNQMQEMKQHCQFILICDGYDESQLTINLHKTNRLNQQDGWRTKMIISCRTQFLGPVYMDRFVPQPTDHYQTARVDLFQEAVIAPFSKEQVQAYVECYVPLEPRPWVTEDYMRMLTTIPNLMDLVKNPFLLTLTLEALPGVTKGQTNLTNIRITRVQLYDHFVDEWLGVNLRRLQNNVLDKEDRAMLAELVEMGFLSLGIDYATRLAQAIFDKHDGNPVIQYVHFSDKKSWMAEFFGSQPEIRLLRDASPLTRTGTLYQFLHRSMLECFFSRTVFDPRASIDRDEFAPQRYSFSPVTPSFNSDGPLFKRNLLMEPSVIDFLCERVKNNPEFKQKLLAVVALSRTNPEASLAAANAITILVKSSVYFNGADLRGIRIPGANVSGGQFDTAQLQGADLRGVNFMRCWMRKANLDGAQLEGTQFGVAPSFRSASLDKIARLDSQMDEGWLDMATSQERTSLYARTEEHWLEMLCPHATDKKVDSCVFSPDGHLLAMNVQKSVRVYEMTTWTVVHRLHGHNDAVGAVAFSPDSRRLVSGSDDCSLRLWDCLSGIPLLVLRGHRGHVRSVAFLPCGKRVVSASWDASVRVWSSETGASLLILLGHTQNINSVRHTPDGRRLVSAGDDGTIRFWNAETGEPGVIWTSPHKKVLNLAYSPDGQRIVTGHNEGCVQVWNATTGKAGPILHGHTGSITGVAFSPNGQRIATSSFDNTLRLWYASTGASASVFPDQRYAISALSFSPDGRRIAFTSATDALEELRFWDVASSESSTEATGHMGSIHDVRYSSDGSSIFSSSNDLTVRHWDSLKGETVVLSSFPLLEGVGFMVLSPDGQQIATSNNDPTIQLWSHQRGATPEVVLRGHSKNVISFVYSSCGRWIASCSWDKTVRLWECSRSLAEVNRQGRILAALPGDSDDSVRSLAFSPDGSLLATCDSNSTVCVFDLQKWTLLKTLTLNPTEGAFERELKSVSAMVLSPDSQQLAFGNRSGFIQIWDFQYEVFPGVELKGHRSSVVCLAYSPCGQWLTSGGVDNTVQLYRSVPQSGQSGSNWTKVAVVNGLFESITCIAWSPSVPLEFVTGCKDRSIRVWRVSSSSNGDNRNNSNNGCTAPFSVGLLWGSNIGRLCVTDLSLKDAEGDGYE
ncbi:hypothetical protein BGW39_007242 [Mortierella sp. 14UC]|nr:hypothetical protein BGW39_007242 [Mortierella sp. 14UC]